MTADHAAAPDSQVAALRAEIAALEAERGRLTYELGHRVKNTLGVVQALASQTLRGAATPQEAAEALTRRILSLARANDAILKDGWTRAGMMTAARRVLQAEGADAGPLDIQGPDLTIPAGAALSFCMALHELASNARRHGAWSVPGGHVLLTWDVEPCAEGDRLVLTWKETDGPAVSEPPRRKFGLRLVEQSLRSAFGQTVTLAFEPDGLACRVAAPFSREG